MLFVLLQDLADYLSVPPFSFFFILFLAVATSLISTLLTKWLVDTDEMNRKQVLQKAHQEEKEKIIALAEVDVERYRRLRKRWERKEAMYKKSQQKMSLQRLKPTCITFVPMIVIFTLVRLLYVVNGVNLPVALSPMNANDIPLIGPMMAGITAGIEPWTIWFYGDYVTITSAMGWINFTAYYFLCSLGMNALIQRLIGIQTQASGGMSQMMGGSRGKGMEFPDV